MTGPESQGAEEAGNRRRGLCIHPLDLLVLALAVFLAVVAYTFLFEMSPVPRPVDPLLGQVLTVEFVPDREWKLHFLEVGEAVLVEDQLLCDVEEVSVEPAHPAGGRVRARLRIRERSAQRPDALTGFRGQVRRGTRLRVSDDRSEVLAEVVDVGSP